LSLADWDALVSVKPDRVLLTWRGPPLPALLGPWVRSCRWRRGRAAGFGREGGYAVQGGPGHADPVAVRDHAHPGAACHVVCPAVPHRDGRRRDGAAFGSAAGLGVPDAYELVDLAGARAPSGLGPGGSRGSSPGCSSDASFLWGASTAAVIPVAGARVAMDVRPCPSTPVEVRRRRAP